jgi:hypothetical protein
MFRHLRSLLLFALYQCCLLAGILLLPVGVVASRVGVPFPYHRVVARAEEAYDRATNR